MTPLSRYRVPKIAQHAAFGHMNDYDLETQSLVGTDQVVGARDSVPACARSAPRHIRWPQFAVTRHAHVETTCRWSIWPTRFRKATLCATGKIVEATRLRSAVNGYFGIGLQRWFDK
jgi:hypothetical protein